MSTITAAFGLKKAQAELDFVDVSLDTDNRLFLDPFAISQRPEPLCRSCHDTLASFFQLVIESIRAGKETAAKRLLNSLREPNETRLGFSVGKPQGAGIGHFQADQLYDALAKSTAVRTGFISSLEECELMIDGISADKISDLTTNVIRRELVDYTASQCTLWDIPVVNVAMGPFFDISSGLWLSDYANLPVVNNRPILFVPKIIARFYSSYAHQQYYQHYVLNFLQAQELQAQSNLVRALKNGRTVVYKKDVEAKYPRSKAFLFEISKKHPDLLKRYRAELERLEKQGPQAVVGPQDERDFAKMLIQCLSEIPAGSDTASVYHSFMLGALEFIFFPHLLHPRKEVEIHEGRKRIDIVLENGATNGIFHRLHSIRKLPCSHVAIECKNYSTDIANSELDQITGRFSVNRGQFGFICCRSFEDRSRFVSRCIDTFKDGRGLVIPIDDHVLCQVLDFISNGKRPDLDATLSRMIDEVWVS